LQIGARFAVIGPPGDPHDMLTNRAKYAIKALLYLSQQRGSGPVHAGLIAEQQCIPLKFLELILLQLRNNGIIKSKVGKGGGHELVRDPADIDLLTVVRAIDGPVAPLPCLSKTAYSRCDDCPDEKTCGARRLFKDIHEATLEIMGKTTLADAFKTRSGHQTRER
jgi:Rrf2 family protein